tara:strand:- start:682 stop:1725 length:1044 start_codon:yes stop_codon:yes gene_type:complete
MDYSKRFITNDPMRVSECKNDNCYTPTYNQLKSHSRKDNCWIGINGKVYNITKYKEDLKKIQNKLKKDSEIEYVNNKIIILTDYKTNNSEDYTKCTIDNKISSNMCKVIKNDNYIKNEEIENNCGNSSQDKEIIKKLKETCNIYKYEIELLDVKNYKLGLLCGKHYDNINEKNIFYRKLDYKNYIIGEIKYYKFYKLFIIFFNFLVLVAIFYILKYKMNNYYMLYILLPLILYVLYCVYKYIEIYFDKEIKSRKIKNEIYKNDITNINTFSIEKISEILKEINQRLISKILILLLIIFIIIYGLIGDVKNIKVILTIICIIVLYLFYVKLKNKLYKDYEPRFSSPNS